MNLANLSTKALLDSISGLLGSERSALARLIAHLVEVEDRRAHLEMACSSLFDFCVRKLRLSEGEAYRRINAARLVRRFPVVLGMIESGRIHLSALVLLRDHLDEANHLELLDVASGQTKSDLQKIIATRFPRPEVPTSIRKLPQPATKPAMPMAAAKIVGVARAAAPTETAPAEPAIPRSASQETSSLFESSQVRSESDKRVAAPKRSGTVEPLSASRYKVELTASAELKEKLDRAAQLLAHRQSEADLAGVVERALDLLIASIEKERFGKTERPRRARACKSGYVARATRREVVVRDGEQCSYVSPDGERCSARSHLELDHRHARALGGTDDASNVRLLCRAHNQFCAERVFGRRHVAEKIRLRQEKCARERQLPSPIVATSRRGRSAEPLEHGDVSNACERRPPNRA